MIERHAMLAEQRALVRRMFLGGLLPHEHARLRAVRDWLDAERSQPTEPPIQMPSPLLLAVDDYHADTLDPASAADEGGGDG